MDVRCERCKTEYEFDDARITEAGVTVKCTTCGHVFKVKKKALVFTVPVKPDEAALAAPPPPASPPQREWKVRQQSGNVFTFKELTTLQKWIVERKVSRDDEISLTGESWKRLGNIAELASFFQVVDEAEKARQVSAMQGQGYLGYPPQPPSGIHPMPRVPATPEPYAPAPQPSLPVPPPPHTMPPAEPAPAPLRRTGLSPSRRPGRRRSSPTT